MIDEKFPGLTSFEKSTLCKILGDIYCQLFNAENIARFNKITWEKCIGQ
jgi:hypothetical protein